MSELNDAKRQPLQAIKTIELKVEIYETNEAVPIAFADKIIHENLPFRIAQVKNGDELLHSCYNRESVEDLIISSLKWLLLTYGEVYRVR